MDNTDGNSVIGVIRMLGQEKPVERWIPVERAPTGAEKRLWEKAERLAKRTMLIAQMSRIQFVNIVNTYKWASDNGIMLDSGELPELENRMNNALDQIDFLQRAQGDVNRWKLGVSPSATGNDLDIVSPSEISLSGVWIPIAVGAVVVSGIIARWAYLEKEVQKISDRYNGILHWSDMYICSNPKSKKCIEWREHKTQGGYQKNETILDSIKSSIKSVGGGLSKGFGIGLAILIPILALFYLPRRKGAQNG